MFTLALILFLSIFAIYAIVAVAIVYHLKKFEPDPNVAKHAIIIFLAVSIILFLLATFVFLKTPWEEFVDFV